MPAGFSCKLVATRSPSIYLVVVVVAVVLVAAVVVVVLLSLL